MENITIEETPSPIVGKETRTTLVLGLGFFCVFASFMALQNIQGSLNDEGGLGVISLSCLYGAAILSAIFAPALLKLIGAKRAVMLAFSGHILYVACNFYPSFYTLLPSSIALGTVTVPLWTAAGTYLTSCAFSSAQTNNVDISVILSKMNGIFFTLFELSNIAGNLLVSLVLYQGQYNGTETNTSSFCGSNDCPREDTKDIIADPEPMVVYIMLGTFLGFVSLGLVTVTMFLPRLQKQASFSIEDVKLLGSLFIFIYKTDVKFLIPFFIYIALEQQFVFTEITKSFVSCPIGIQNVGYVMTSYGVCTTLSTVFFSQIAKFTPRFILIFLAAILQLTLMVWMYHWVPLPDDVINIYLLASLWGVAEGIWKTQTNVILGDIFRENKHEAFAVYEGVKSLSFTATFSYSSFICVYIKLFIAMGVLTLALLLYAYVEIRHSRVNNKTEPQKSEPQNSMSNEAVENTKF